MPSPRSVIWILSLTILGGIGTIGYTLFQKAMTTQYQLGYRMAENDLIKAATDAGRTSTRKFRDETIKNRALSDVDLDRRAVSLGIMCHGSDC